MCPINWTMLSVVKMENLLKNLFMCVRIEIDDSQQLSGKHIEMVWTVERCGRHSMRVTQDEMLLGSGTGSSHLKCMYMFNHEHLFQNSGIENKTFYFNRIILCMKTVSGRLKCFDFHSYIQYIALLTILRHCHDIHTVLSLILYF